MLGRVSVYNPDNPDDNSSMAVTNANSRARCTVLARLTCFYFRGARPLDVDKYIAIATGFRRHLLKPPIQKPPAKSSLVANSYYEPTPCTVLSPPLATFHDIQRRLAFNLRPCHSDTLKVILHSASVESHSACTEMRGRRRSILQCRAKAKEGFQCDRAERIVPKRVDKQEPHRNDSGAGLSSFEGVFADKSAIGRRAQPANKSEEKQQRHRAAFEKRLESIVMCAVDHFGNKIRNPFMKRV